MKSIPSPLCAAVAALFAAVPAFAAPTLGSGSGSNSMVIDPSGASGSTAAGADAIAVGGAARADGMNTVAVGRDAKAGDAAAVAVGANTQATNASTALGDHSKALGLNSTALGWHANSAGRSDVMIGKNAGSGTSNTANFNNIGIGENAVAHSGAAITNVIGIGANAASGIQRGHNIAIGANANSTQGGKAAVATENNIAVGQNARAAGGGALALGYASEAAGQAAVAMGVNSKAAGANAAALGNNANAAGANAVAIGGSAQAINAANASGVNAVAVGMQSDATATGATALGNNAQATHQNAVALGTNSATAAVVNSGRGSATVNGITYGGFAAAAPASMVSIGASGQERTLANLAAGRISATSTDAVNGSQLYMTQQALGHVGSSAAAHLGGGAALQADGKISAPAYTVSGGNGSLYGAAANNVGAALANLNNYVNEGFKVQGNGSIQGAVTPGEGINFTDGSHTTATVSAEAGGITNIRFDLNQSTQDTLAQVATNSAAIQTNAGNIAANTAAIQTNAGNIAANTAAIQNNAGNIAANTAAIQTNAGNIAANTAAIAQGLNFHGDSGAAFNRPLGQTARIVGGAGGVLTDNNIGVQSNGSDTLTVKLAQNIDLGSSGSLKAGNTTLDGDGVRIDGGASIGSKGVDAGGQAVTNVAAGTQPTDAVNVAQLNQAVAQVNAGDQGVSRLNERIGHLEKDARAGIAGAIAQGSIPQVTRPGATGIGVGTGNYRGQSALSVGISSMSDGGNWILKGSFSLDTQGHKGFGAGALYQW